MGKLEAGKMPIPALCHPVMIPRGQTLPNSVGHHLSYWNLRTPALSHKSPNLHSCTVIWVGVQEPQPDSQALLFTQELSSLS